MTMSEREENTQYWRARSNRRCVTAFQPKPLNRGDWVRVQVLDADELAAHDRALREQIAREHGIGDLTSRPLRDSQDEITRLESLVHYLRRENRRLENTIARGEDQTND